MISLSPSCGFRADCIFTFFSSSLPSFNNILCSSKCLLENKYHWPQCGLFPCKSIYVWTKSIPSVGICTCSAGILSLLSPRSENMVSLLCSVMVVAVFTACKIQITKYAKLCYQSFSWTFALSGVLQMQIFRIHIHNKSWNRYQAEPSSDALIAQWATLESSPPVFQFCNHFGSGCSDPKEAKHQADKKSYLLWIFT